MARRENGFDLFGASLAVIGASAATLAGAWIYQGLGYAPCELCLLQRWAYYLSLPLAALALWSAWERRPGVGRAALAFVSLLFAANAALAIYHSGVELKFWPGPAGCAGGFVPPGDLSDFHAQLQATRPVRCDEPALYIFGLTMANWNILISALLALIATLGARETSNARAGG